jgi:hypothetical protein
VIQGKESKNKREERKKEMIRRRIYREEWLMTLRDPDKVTSPRS